MEVGVEVGGSGVEKSRLRLTSAKVEVEVEAELGNNLSQMAAFTGDKCVVFLKF